MSLFHYDDDSQLQGVTAIPQPVDDIGPTYTGPTYEPYDRATEEYHAYPLGDDATLYRVGEYHDSSIDI
jgi:hypothetical protein